MNISDVKVMMLKGEKGDTGYPSDEQVLAQVTKYIEENPRAVIDEELIKQATNDYLDSDLTLLERIKTMVSSAVDSLEVITNAEIDSILKGEVV